MTSLINETAINLTDYIYSPDVGINPDTGEDLSEKMATLLDYSNSVHKGIYFPGGVYLFSKDVFMKSYNSLKGALNGTVFRGIADNGNSVMFGDNIFYNTVKQLRIENIIFDNARVHFYGRKSSISVNHNVFINTVTAKGVAQLTCSTNAYTIKGNVFMRGSGFPGVGINTFSNAAGLVIEQNFMGSVSDIDTAKPWLDNETLAMLATLLKLRAGGIMPFENKQGDFVAGWYSTSGLKKGVFRKNFFTGSKEELLFNPVTGETDILRDHNIYIKMYDQVEIVQNYFGGWPGNDLAPGQLKFRNAKGLVFAANYMEDISFNARPYNDLEDAWLIMQDTFIFNNFINNGMISYWQNFVDSENVAIDVKNYLVFRNAFINRTDSQVLISSPPSSLSLNQFLCAENRFVKTGELVPTSRLFIETDLEVLHAMLPEYASQYLSVEPIMP